MSELILASKSPRRKQLLKLLGYPFRVMVSGIEENNINGELPSEHVIRLSIMKALDIGRKIDRGIVIGADTIVVLDGDILGKPATPEDAISMLMRLQGRTHKVYTGFSLYNVESEQKISDFESTDVTMHTMSEDCIHRYVQTGEPLDKAGSYGIQGYGSALVTSIHGCYFTVMGLPLAKLMESLHSFTGGRYSYFGTDSEKNS